MHTNETQYYRLPQYVGSDIINPLVDTNDAYEKIDTTMHNIAAEAAQDTADVAALQSKVGSGIFETTAQNATDAVNEVVGELNTADTGIKARLTTAESDIDTLQGQMVTAQGNIVDMQNNKANQSDVNALKQRIVHSVESDGVKTWSDILTEMFTHIATLNFADLSHCFIHHYTSTGARIIPLVDYKPDKSRFIFEGWHYLILDEIVVEANSTLFTSTTFTIDAGTGAVTGSANDLTNSVVPDGRTFELIVN